MSERVKTFTEWKSQRIEPTNDQMCRYLELSQYNAECYYCDEIPLDPGIWDLNLWAHWSLVKIAKLERTCGLRNQAIKDNVLELIELAKLLRIAKCPDENCDGKGTVLLGVYQHENGEVEQRFQQCQWCNERDEALEQGQERTCKPHGMFPCRQCGTKHYDICKCEFCREQDKKHEGKGI